MTIIALDPGLTTGYAFKHPDVPAPMAGQVVGRFELYAFVEPFVTQGNVLVMESFTINANTAKKSQQLDPLYILGHLEALAQQRGVPCVLQAPAMAKSFATDAKLKAAGWWVPGQDHARDALRHLMTYLCTNARTRPDLGGADLLNLIVKGLT